SNKALHMHPLVHTWAFDRLSQEEKTSTVKMAVSMYAIASKSSTIYEESLLAKHISYLTNFLGQADRNSSTKAAVRVFERVLARQQKWQTLDQMALYRYRDEDNGDLKALRMQLNARLGNTDIHTSLKKARYILEEWSKRMPLKESEIAESQVHLALCLLVSGRSQEEVNEAGDLLKQANEYFMNIHGPDHSRTLSARRIYSMYYCVIQDFNNAIKMLTETISMVEKTLSDEPIVLLRFKENLGMIYFRKLIIKDSTQPWVRDEEDCVKAKAIFADVKNGYEELLGPDHEMVLRVKEVLERLEVIMDEKKRVYGANKDDGSEDYDNEQVGSVNIHDAKTTANAIKRKKSGSRNHEHSWTKFRNRIGSLVSMQLE
ncbi:MAG: hypothetical protein Q9191_008447, partial [Dirinaria sp. TL-2023a]